MAGRTRGEKKLGNFSCVGPRARVPTRLFGANASRECRLARASKRGNNQTSGACVRDRTSAEHTGASERGNQKPFVLPCAPACQNLRGSKTPACSPLFILSFVIFRLFSVLKVGESERTLRAIVKIFLP